MIDSLEYVNDFVDNTSLAIVKKKQFLIVRNFFKVLNKILKRLMDFIVGIIGVILLVPITIFVFIVKIITKDTGPIFYTQLRIGVNGKLFKMYKYRTMIVNAEDALEKILNEDDKLKHEYDTYKKIKNDPRMTKLGKLLRRTSLDEFPQFLNVVLGNMSIVGPRPYLPNEREDMKSFYQYIIQCKPGITGLWQISGRNRLSFHERLILDMKYYRFQNIFYDVGIMLKTVFKVIKHEGVS